MRRTVLALTLLAVAVGPAPAAHAGLRVVGGHDAPAGVYDAVAKVTFAGGSCTGTLISRQWVLSAGHCASATGALFGTPIYYPTQSYAIVLGTTRTDGAGGSAHGVDSIRTPPGYVGSRNFDVSLLHLTQPAAQTPVQIAGRGAESLWTPGTLETIAGFGVTSGGGAQPARMQVAQVPVVADTDCAAAYPNDPRAPSYPDVFESGTQLCAGYPQGGTDTCQGDSGGPLFGHDADGALKLVGSTSKGNGCAQPGYPGIYARIAAPPLREWIRSIVADGIDDHVALTPGTKSQPGAPSTPSAPTAPATPAPGGARPPSPGTTSASGTASGAAGDTARFAAGLSPARPLRATLARRGLRVTLDCSAACDATLTLRVDAATVRRTHIGHRTVGTARVARSRGGRVRVHVRLRRGVAGLARDRAAAFSVLAVVAPAAGGRAVTISRAVRLR